MISLFIPVASVKNAKAEDVGTISISVDKTELEKGETVRVTVSLNSSVPISDVMFEIRYDNKVFENSSYAGIINIDVDGTQDGFTTYQASYEFKVISVPGNNSSSFIIENLQAIEIIKDEEGKENYKEVSFGLNNSTVRVIDHKASSNANLASINLSTGYLWPEFNPNTT